MTDTTGPEVVRLGVLTQVEFDGLSPREQLQVEATTAELVSRDGAAAFQNDRERHRADIWLAYGLCDSP